MAAYKATLDFVRATIENEGFDYAFQGFSDFAEVKDEKFHTLRETYLKARAELSDYVQPYDA